MLINAIPGNGLNCNTELLSDVNIDGDFAFTGVFTNAEWNSLGLSEQGLFDYDFIELRGLQNGRS